METNGMEEATDLLSETLPIHNDVRRRVEKTLRATGVRRVDAAYVRDRRLLATIGEGTAVVRVAADIGLATVDETLSRNRLTDVTVAVVPWGDVAGVRMHASFTNADGDEATTIRLAVAIPILDESATDVGVRGAYRELGAFAAAVLSQSATSHVELPSV